MFDGVGANCRSDLQSAHVPRRAVGARPRRLMQKRAPHHNQLIGRYRPSTGPIPFVAIRPDALMTLTRHR
jgi:hypothetical protein